MNTQETHTSYKIYKNEAFVGYLIGSFHSNHNPTEYKNLQESLQEKITNCSTVFIECKLPHYSSLTFGYERAILETVENSQNKIDVKYFENNKFQHAMLASSIWFGTKIKFMPWLSYKILNKYPTFFQILSNTVSKFFWFYNVIYNLCTRNAHSKAVQEYQIDQQKKLIELYEKFKNGKAICLDSFAQQQFLMKDRDKNMSQIIIKNANPDNITLFAVGASHLPGETGIVNQLTNAGFTLQNNA